MLLYPFFDDRQHGFSAVDRMDSQPAMMLPCHVGPEANSP